MLQLLCFAAEKKIRVPRNKSTRIAVIHYCFRESFRPQKPPMEELPINKHSEIVIQGKQGRVCKKSPAGFLRKLRRRACQIVL